MLRGVGLTIEAKRVAWRAVAELGYTELLVLAYFVREVSVGLYRAIAELEATLGIGRVEAERLVKGLASKGFLEVVRGDNVNAARWIREALSREAEAMGGDMLAAGRRLSAVLEALAGRQG